MLSDEEYLSHQAILCFLGEGSLKLTIHEKQRWIPHCASWAVINFLPSFWKKKEPRTFETFGQNAQERNRGNLKSSRMFFSAPWVHPRPSFSFLGVVSPIFFEGWNIHFLMVGRLISFLGNRFFFRGYCWWKKSCTSWYGKYPNHLQGSIHRRWCRISSINSMLVLGEGILLYSPSYTSNLTPFFWVFQNSLLQKTPMDVLTN